MKVYVYAEARATTTENNSNGYSAKDCFLLLESDMKFFVFAFP